jgi:hypothetical protein
MTMSCGNRASLVVCGVVFRILFRQCEELYHDSGWPARVRSIGGWVVLRTELSCSKRAQSDA